MLAIFSLPVLAQDTVSTAAYQQYPEGIVKFIFRPANYARNENVSDAVILRPQSPDFIPVAGIHSISLPGIPGLKISATGDSLGNGFIFSLKPGETVTGGGERALPLNRRGYAFNLYNNPWYGYGEGADNLNYSVPFFMIPEGGYGLFFDNPSTGRVDIGKKNPNEFTALFYSGEINVFVIPGKNQQEILAKYNRLTGTQPLPPRWALGNFMSRFGYTSQAEVEEISGKMKEHKIPFDAVIIDLFWFGDSIKETMGNLQWVNKTKWPDPKGMIGRLKEKHINTILVTEPFVVKKSLNYENSKPFHATEKDGKPYLLTDFYFGHGGLLDIFRKDAKDWFWQQHVPQMNNGIEAWWGDLGEPEKHPADIYHNLKDLGFNRLFSANEVHNIYGHNWTKMLYNKYAENYPEKRLFSLNRSGFSGSQRYGIFPWSGDVSRSWSGYRAQLPLMLGMSMSGIPYIHADAGGFAGGEGDNELYARWLQFAAFTPVFRPHGTALFEVDKQAYSFPSEPALIESPYREIVTRFINLRYKMLPYNYTMAFKQTTEGKPLVSPLSYYFPGDTTLNNNSNAYMWGADLLIAPVLEKAATFVDVHLPKNITWYNIGKATDGDFSGVPVVAQKEAIRFSTNLNSMPVFIKEGSFLPLDAAKNFSTTADLNGREMDIHYYASSKPSEGEVFSDDGRSKSSVANGNYELTSFSAVPAEGGLTLNISNKVNGNYEGKPQSRKLNFYIHGSDVKKKARVNGKKLKKRNGTYTVVYSGQPLEIKFKK